MTVYDTLYSFVRDSMPRGLYGAFWQDEAGERYATALADAFLPVTEHISVLHEKVAPWGTEIERSVLEQWFEYLAPGLCIPPAVDDEDLREQVISALASSAVFTTAGFIARMEGAIMHIEVTEVHAATVLTFTLPQPIQPYGSTWDIWHAPLIHSEAVIRCVAENIMRASAIIRMITPSAYGLVETLFGDGVKVVYSEMRGCKIRARRRLGAALLETATLDVSGASDDIVTAATIFPALSPGSFIGGQTIEVEFLLIAAGDRAVLPAFSFDVVL